MNEEESKSDDLDIEILKILEKDGRKTFNFIAETLKQSQTLGKSPVTIKKHIEELDAKGFIKGYGAHIDYEKLGYDIMAIIDLSVSKGKMVEVENDISNDPHVFGIYDATGDYDAIVLARFKSRKDLNQMVKKINSYEYVIRTNTHLILNIIKEGSSLEDLIKKDKLIE